MSNSTKHMVFLIALLSCGAVLADETSDKLTRIEAETLLLKAREKQLDVQASILSKQNDIAVRQNAGNLLAQNSVSGDPVVHGVEGVGRNLFATLQLGNGNIVDVQAGDVLPNGMRVVSIAPGSVIVQKGAKRIRLASYAPRQASFNPNFPAPGLALPLSTAAAKGAAK